ncbi:hypothetical protein [Maridesulfovibrio salexigens]|uniref:Peptidase M50B-like n=1 Tax=Maridesulfovibrio salexigens (strain ATCC 14822 / DSM 2638 / NCIMB 8403 / VKM B-1763) TaxID=526222 RepID=C6BUA0_MARSD|nr:hypothetical protein [Maridesulfovibrio salexigens]ACS79909.1 hypothetical protein Desal_1847 [Maridesulfovibrio salexigens DSM 2638]
MKESCKYLQAARYLGMAILTILLLQSCMVVVHEFTHSTMAYLLGEMKSPLGIVWGNPIMMTGWDEGVNYSRIFAEGNDWHAAAIGFSPLVMHSIVTCVCLFLLNAKELRNRWAYHWVYWLAVVNLMELVAYIYMRAFADHGDVGRFNQGMHLSAWWVFLLGGSFVTWMLWHLFRYSLPRLQDFFAANNSVCAWSMLCLISFTIFLWGSGIRVMAYVDGVQSLFGVAGILIFFATLIVFRVRL